jgi:mono/diheme cytochrome c family protein
VFLVSRGTGRFLAVTRVLIGRGLTLALDDRYRHDMLISMRRPVRLAAVALVLALSAASAGAQSQGEPDSQTAWGGIFTSAQASTGATLYSGRCSSCHRSDLSGGNGPALTLGGFGASWEGQPLSALVSRIQSTMPPTDPGSLTDAQAAAIVAHLLQRQGYPAGSTTLSASSSSLYRSHRLSPLTWAAPAAGNQKSIAVTASDTGHSWFVTQLPSWLSSSVSGATGSGTTTIIAAPNTSGATRTATILIANRPLSVTQESTGSSSVPSVPSNFAAAIVDQLVTFTWTAPVAGATPTRYRIEAGTSADSFPVMLDVGAVTTHAVPGVPFGSYVVRIRAGNDAGFGDPSVAIPVVVTAIPPGTPRNPLVTVTGATVRFTWDAPASGSTPTGYQIEAGLAAGRTDVGPIPLTTRVFEVGSVPDGRYFLRVRAVAGSTPGAATADVVADVVPDVRPPGAPAALDATVAGRTVTLRWTAATGGAPASVYVLEVGSSSGASNLVPGLELSASQTSLLAPDVPSGQYFIRVRARSAAGVLGPPSAEAVVTVTGSH